MPIYKNEELLCVERIPDELINRVHSDLYVIDDSTYNSTRTNKYPNQRILSLLDMKQKDLIYFDRNEVEDDKDYQQLVVGLLIRCNENVLLLECIDGDMVGQFTMVEGHVDRDKRFDEYLLNTVLYHNVIREFNEEIAVDCSKLNRSDIGALYSPQLKYITWNNVDEAEIAYRHIGFIYELDLSAASHLFTPEILGNGEPHKNRLHFINIPSLKLETWSKLCSWTKEVLFYYHYTRDMNRE